MTSKKQQQQKQQKRKDVESESEGVPTESAPKSETTRKKQKTVKNVSQSSLAPIQPSEQDFASSYSTEDPSSSTSKSTAEEKRSSKTTGKKVLKEQKDVKSESSFAPRRSDRIARQDSDLASATRNLKLSSSTSKPSSTSYSVENLPFSASKFKKRDVKALKLDFLGASTENAVIPDVEVTIPEKYIADGIEYEILGNSKFNVENIQGLTDGEVQTFLAKLHDVVLNGVQVIGTDETFTDTLVDNLLRIAKLDTWPLRIRNHPPCNLYIEDEPRVSSDPKFVIKLRNHAILVVEDKHLKNVGHGTDFGESQIAVEILACGSENIHSLGRSPTDQSLWAVRVITTFVTFYKATIPAEYWMELEDGLPQKKVKVRRWPAENGLTTGFDLATTDGRKSVLSGLVKIREFLKNQSATSTQETTEKSTSKKEMQKAS